jgi:hypothetical protein
MTTVRIGKAAECLPLLFRTLPKVFVEHLFPARGMEVGGVRYDTVEVKKDGVVLVAIDPLALGLPHKSLSYPGT